MRPWRRALRIMLAVATLVAGWLVSPTQARGKMMIHYDLTSLAFQSDAIVLARRVAPAGDRTSQSWSVLQPLRHVVVKSYAGSLQVDETVDVAYAGYELDPQDWARNPSLPKGSVFDEQVILFLKKDASGRTSPPYSLVASGLRVLLAGKVFRFEQFDNPGPYIPVPQGRDRGTAEPLALDEFEVDLQKAIARAGNVHAAVRDPAGHRRELLAFVGPADGDLTGAPAIDTFSFERDAVAGAALEAIGRTRDLELYLEAVSRGRGDAAISSRPFDPEQLVAYASTTSAPLHRRLAALRVIALQGFHKGAPAERRMVALLEDPSAEIRIGAAIGLAPDNERPDVVAAFFDRWSAETEEAVLSAILEQGHRHGFAARLPRKALLDPFVRTSRRGLMIRVEWSALDATHPWSVVEGVLEVRDKGEVVRMATVKKEEISSWSSSGFGGATLLPSLERRLEPGTYELGIALRLSREGAEISRTLALTPLTVRSPDDPDELPAPATSAPAALDVHEARIHGGGCHCTMASGPGPTGWALLLGLCAVFLSRKR